MLLNRVHIAIEKYTAGCQQTFCWWQPVVTRHFASDNRLSPDILLVTTGCQQTKKSGDNRLSADLAKNQWSTTRQSSSWKIYSSSSSMANMAGRRNKNAFTFVLKLLIMSQMQILGVYYVVWGGLDVWWWFGAYMAGWLYIFIYIYFLALIYFIK